MIEVYTFLSSLTHCIGILEIRPHTIYIPLFEALFFPVFFILSHLQFRLHNREKMPQVPCIIILCVFWLVFKMSPDTRHLEGKKKHQQFTISKLFVTCHLSPVAKVAHRAK